MKRIKVIGGPWPERYGLEGVVVPDPGDGVYPFTKKRSKDEVIVKIDNDPFTPSYRDWSRALSWTDVEVIG